MKSITLSTLLIKAATVLFAAMLLLGCQIEEVHTPDLKASEDFSLIEGEYSIKLKWKYNPDTRIKRVQIYRGRDKKQLKPYVTISQPKEAEFVDNNAGVRKGFFYSMNFLLEDGTESPHTDTLYKLALEPINTNTPKNGEVGGSHYAYWRFNSRTFERIRHKFTIHENISNKDRLYYQFYQGFINDTIGFYYGIQTHVSEPGKSGDKFEKGVIFSRWGTRDPKNYHIAEEGWAENAGHEGDFIGVRNKFEWKIGEYETDLRKDSSDVAGDWYGLHIRELPNGPGIYIGSLRFEKSDRSSGIKSNGITWLELYWKDVTNSTLPGWHVSVDDVTVNDTEKPTQVLSVYSKTNFVGFGNIFTTGTGDVHFLMGPKVKQFHREGNL